jgi:hypothetical protein
VRQIKNAAFASGKRSRERRQRTVKKKSKQPVRAALLDQRNGFLIVDLSKMARHEQKGGSMEALCGSAQIKISRPGK